MWNVLSLTLIFYLELFKIIIILLIMRRIDFNEIAVKGIELNNLSYIFKSIDNNKPTLKKQLCSNIRSMSFYRHFIFVKDIGTFQKKFDYY